MAGIMRVCRPATTMSPGWGKRSRVLGLALLTAVGLSACVEVPPGPAYEPGVSVGVSFYQPTYPNMVLVPGYPVYYYPYGNANYFFYGGTYWLYQGDRWYSSNWYNGPWTVSGPNYVPYYLLQVPVRYYRAPPPWFHGWHADEPPHWGEHWGRDWEEHHRGWSEPDRTIPPAPLPKYQAAYTGNRYPHDRAQQDRIRNQNYHYESHESVTPPASRPSERPSYSPQEQEQWQPHGPPAAAPRWQPPQQQAPPAPQYQAPTQHPTSPQYPPPHEQGEWQQRSPPSPAPQSQRPEPQQQEDRPNHSQAQPVPGNRPWTTGTPPQTEPHQQQHRESPPTTTGQPSHPAPQHSQATPPSQESSAPPPKGQAKKPPPPDKSGDNQDDQH